MRVTNNITSLFGGVSQQPAPIRLPSQHEELLNIDSTILDGISGRPNTEYVATLSTVMDGTSCHVHTILRDAVERYIVVFTGVANTPIEIFEPNGTKKVVKYGHLSSSMVFTEDNSVKDYLQVANPPSRVIKAVTLADYTVIVNSEKTVAYDNTEPLETKVNEALVYIKQSPPETPYTLTVDGTSVSYQSGSGSSLTRLVAENLRKKLIDAAIPDLTVTRLGSLLVLKYTDNRSFSVSGSDGYGDQAMFIIQGSVNKYSDLPPSAPGFTRIAIKMDSRESFKQYYVEYHEKEGWTETRGYNQYNRFNPSTMPHRLVRMQNGEFVVAPIIWSERKVGDLDTAPPPSFVGNKISNIAFYRNRLCFLTGDNVVFSRAGEFFNFWPSTALEVLDDDPIDVSVASNEVVNLREALPFNKNLLLRSDFQEFILSADSLLTPSTVSINPTTQYETLQYSTSAAIGSNLYFCSPRGNFVSIREYFIQPDTYVDEAADVTIHVPEYIPKGDVQLLTCPTLDILLARSSGDVTSLYVYRPFWAGIEKVQSAWGKWTFQDRIMGAALLETDLYLIFKRSSSYYLERIKLSPEVTGSLPFRVHLDSLCQATGVYSSANDTTTWTFPYSDSTSGEYTVVHSSSGLELPNVTKLSPTTIQSSGRFDQNPMWLGRRYNRKWVLSPWFLKDQKEAPILEGRLQILNVTFQMAKTGSFEFQVKVKGGPELTSHWTPKKVGLFEFNNQPIFSGVHRFGVKCQNTQVTLTVSSKSHLPFSFQGVTYEGSYTGRSTPR